MLAYKCVKLYKLKTPHVLQAVAEHLWWEGGRPIFKRFFMWSVGDGQLAGMYPHLAYFAAPTCACDPGKRDMSSQTLGYTPYTVHFMYDMPHHAVTA